MKTLLIINTVALCVCIALIVLLTVGILRAEWKVYKLTGKSLAFRRKK